MAIVSLKKTNFRKYWQKSGKITNQIFFEDFFCCLGKYAYLCSVKDGITFRDRVSFQHIVIIQGSW